jgi:hypothetical protein
MKQWFFMPLLAGAILGLTLWGSNGKMSAEQPDYPPPGPKGKGPPGEKGRGRPGEKGGPGERHGPPGKADHDLRHAYEVLSDVNGQIAASKEALPRDTTALYGRAKEIYRAAHKSFKDGDNHRAGELAKAANDAGHGLQHVLRGSLPPVADLPLPPDGPDGPPPPPPPPQGRRGGRPEPREDADAPPPPPRGPGAKGRPAPPDEEDRPAPPPREGRRPGPPREDFDAPPPPPPPEGARDEEGPARFEEAEQPPPPPPPPGRPGKTPPRPGDGDDQPPPPSRRGERDNPPPPPPPRHEEAQPWQSAHDALRRAKNRLDEAGEETGAGKAFLDGAHGVYTQARKAYLAGDYRKAVELARGADAWTLVAEHLQHAGYEGSTLRTPREGAPPPPPEGRREGRQPPPPPPGDEATGRRRPPPPPPGDQGPDNRRPGPGARPGRDAAPPPPPPDNGSRSERRPPPPPPEDQGGEKQSPQR